MRTTKYLRSPLLWLIIFITSGICILYYLDILYVRENISWFGFYRIDEYIYHINGILLYIPVLFATVAFGWRGTIVAWFITFSILLYHVITFSPSINSLLSNIIILTMPFFIVILVIIILKWVQRERNFYTEREIERQAYTSQILEAHEDERKNIARELHDDSIQVLRVIANQLESILNTDSRRLSESVKGQVELSRDMIFRVSEDLRRLSVNLRPSVLDDLGLIEALRSLINSYSDDFLKVELILDSEEQNLPANTDIVVFRFVQEALRNIKKHSAATKATVSLNFTRDSVKISVKDNGKGYVLPRPVSKLATENKFGIIGMQERAKIVHGIFNIASKPGEGTLVSLEFKPSYANQDVDQTIKAFPITLPLGRRPE